MNACIKRGDVIEAFCRALDGGYVIQNTEQAKKIINGIVPADVIERREYDAVVAENRFLKAMQAHLTKDMDLTELGKMVATSMEGTR